MEEPYGSFTDFHQIWGRRLTDCLRIFTGFDGGALRIVYGFLPDLGEKASGFLTDLCFLADGFLYGFLPVSVRSTGRRCEKKAVLTSKHSLCYQSLSSAI